jgi:methyl-accepting chemotaxis protein
MEDLPGELSKFSNSINQIGNSVEMLSVELNSLSNSISNGLLDVRADERKAKGQFQVILLGLNKTLDAVIHPLNVTAEYVDRISKGDIPAKITEDYKGDFNEIKNNLNLCIDSLNTMISGANRFVSNISHGKLRYRIDANQLSGEYKNIMQGLNSSMDAVVSLLDSINAPLMSIDKDFNILFLNETGASLDNKQGAELEGMKCFNHFKTDDCNTENCACFKTMNSNRPQSSETIASPGKHKLEILYSGVPIRDKNNNPIGAFEIVFDQTAVKNQMKVAQEISKYQTEKTEELIHSLESLSKGCLDCKFELDKPDDDYLEVAYSNFRKISNALLSSFQAITSVLSSVNMFVVQAEKGNLKYRIDSKTFNGDYRNLVEGVNNILENVLAPINESLAVIETMESGNLSIFMTGEYAGDYQKLKEKQNSLLISLNDVLSNVKNMVVKVDDSTNTISNNTDALAAATLEQSSQAEEVASAVEELSATITQNAISSQKTSDLATENGKLAENGGNIVQETIVKMKDIASVVSASADQIEELGRASSKIGEIISVIDEIADQTNLLALNAAIEAARAGEQGRGFAVVADEVRKLAERTSDATKQISTMIIDVQKETQKAVDAMHKGKIEVDNGISFADNAGEALKKIVNSSKSLKDMVNQMASANEEQSATSEEISKNISSISQVTSESAKRIEGVSNLSDQLKKMTKELAAEISKFRLDDRHHSSNNSEDSLFLQGTKNKLLR